MAPSLSNKPAYGLRVGHEIVKLDKQTLLVGRSENCDIILSGALVSRQHAKLFVDADGVAIEDLSSRNGVLVNGTPIEARTKLAHGDIVILGEEQLKFMRLPPDAQQNTNEVRAADTLVGDTTADSDEATRRGNLLEVLGGVVDKQLALGHGVEAERLLTKQLRITLEQAKVGIVKPDLCERAAQYGIKLAAATNNADWIVYAISMYYYQGKVMPVAMVDELYTLLRKVRGVPIDVVRSYVSQLKNKERSLGPAERFALKRIEGLEHIVLL